ncbi:MAG: CBS domain-containing protein [Chloroflexota bacterium]
MKEGRTVLQAKRFGIYSCTADTTLLDAARRMVEEDISALVVVDEEGYLAGIVSRTDMLRAYLAHDDWAEQPIHEHMTRQVVTVSVDEQLSTVANLLLERNIHRLVVVRQEEGKPRPVAVISDADLMYHMVRDA